MLPHFIDGDYIIALKRPLQRYRTGDVVLADHPVYHSIIKRIASIDGSTIWLRGDGTESVSTEQMGPINSRQIRGKLLWHIKAPR